MALWTPASITTALWLDASDSSTITESGGAVSQWDDKSGNGITMLPNLSYKPTYDATGINGLPAVLFPGPYYHMIGAQTFALTATDYFVAIVYEGDAPTDSNPRYMGFRNANTNFQAGWNSSNCYFTRVGGTTHDTNSSFTTTGTPHIVCHGYESSTSILSVDGELAALGTGGAPTSDSIMSVGKVVISGGYRDASYDFKANGHIAEVIISAGVDTDTRQKIEGYLAWKWGLEANLPSGHPYESAAPVSVSVSGVITDDANLPCQRTIRAYDRATGALITSTTSDPSTGAYSIDLANTDEVQLVALDDSAGTVYNDKIIRVTPS
jgi:hypothetical protein